MALNQWLMYVMEKVKMEEVKMEEFKLGVMENRFADIIWKNAPVASGELVRLCEKELEWKKSTTYTMLRRLCQRGIFKNVDGIVSVVISKEEFAARQSEVFVDENFGGSLPQFLAAFTLRKKLSDKDIDKLQQMIDKERRAKHDE